MKICECADEGYRRLVENPVWTVAVINYAPRFDAANFVRMERHMKTDEVFVLLAGRATLVVGETMERVEMEPTKVYTMEELCYYLYHKKSYNTGHYNSMSSLF